MYFCTSKEATIIGIVAIEAAAMTRKGNPLFGAQSIERVNAVLAELRPFAEKYHAALAQLIIALTSRQLPITHILVGAPNEAQALENAGGGCLGLSASDVREMNGIPSRLKTSRG